MCDNQQQDLKTSDNGNNSIAQPAFRNRLLFNDEEVFRYNAWDGVEWNEKQQQLAVATVAKNSATKLSAEYTENFEKNAASFWNSFYQTHQNRFFQDRNWLFIEFPELSAPKAQNADDANKLPLRIFELGCGVGNTLLPILTKNNYENIQVYGCDFSEHALKLLREESAYKSTHCEVFVMDATLENWSETVPFAENSLDIIVLIFTLSAIKPDNMENIMNNCYRYLRPGGLVLFRDYARYDLAQLRFKDGKCMQDNLYLRGDGTMAYFFSLEEVQNLFLKAGFEEVKSLLDRRLQINRLRLLKMYRIWIQAKFRKPLATSNAN